MSRPWKVLLVTSVAVFMSFLDATIVNIAFPDIERSFQDASLGRPVLDPERLQHRLRGAAGAGGEGGRHRRGAKMFFIGLWTFLARPRRGRAERRVPDRRARPAGGRRRDRGPTSLGLMLLGFPAAKRATATAIWGATGAVAAATGPSLGGVLVDATSWRWVFLVNLLIGIPAVFPAAACWSSAWTSPPTACCRTLWAWRCSPPPSGSCRSESSRARLGLGRPRDRVRGRRRGAAGGVRLLSRHPRR